MLIFRALLCSSTYVFTMPRMHTEAISLPNGYRESSRKRKKKKKKRMTVESTHIGEISLLKGYRENRRRGWGGEEKKKDDGRVDA